MQQLEIEIKFLPADVQAIRQYMAMRGVPSRGRQFENNIVYDTAEATLKRENALLRLRKSTVSTLTLKRPAASPDADFKILDEMEVRISDFATMNRILESLGYRRRFVYEKWRETFAFAHASVCLDTMPYGEFIEIEGSRESIRHAADALGLAWDDRILLNYHEIFSIIRRAFNLEVKDITFDAFAQVPINASVLRPLLSAHAGPV